ncbi:hypothetical protein Bbelb_175740 [Branchiostoma belcheri]|nr:hypothetical protein Bbelb_175740 [Branchiostoma belcheri]
MTENLRVEHTRHNINSQAVLTRRLPGSGLYDLQMKTSSGEMSSGRRQLVWRDGGYFRAWLLVSPDEQVLMRAVFTCPDQTSLTNPRSPGSKTCGFHRLGEARSCPGLAARVPAVMGVSTGEPAATRHQSPGVGGVVVFTTVTWQTSPRGWTRTSGAFKILSMRRMERHAESTGERRRIEEASVTGPTLSVAVTFSRRIPAAPRRQTPPICALWETASTLWGMSAPCMTDGPVGRDRRCSPGRAPAGVVRWHRDCHQVNTLP